MAGRLSLVPTPIGNLEDITLRAIRVLQEADLIAAEDTRTSRRLLGHHGIATPLTSYHDFSRPGTAERLIGELRAGKHIALISDAGTPGISDPSYRLVNAAIEQGIPVEALPGATSIIPALVASGLPTDRFAFLGFLPRKKGRQTALQELVEREETCIALESPHRLRKTLEALAESAPQRQLVLARELSKVHEQYLRGNAGELLAHFEQHEARGEFVLLVEGASRARKRLRQSEDGNTQNPEGSHGLQS